MAASIALYSSSPPATFPSPRSLPSTSGFANDTETGRHNPSSRHSSKQTRGGLSHLLSGGLVRRQSLGLADCLEQPMAVLRPSSASFSSYLDLAPPSSTGRDSFEARASSAVSIPSPHSSRQKDRSPVSVFIGGSSHRSHGSPLSMVAGRECASAGVLASVEAASSVSLRRRPSLPLDARKPLKQSVGFHVGNDGDCLAFHTAGSERTADEESSASSPRFCSGETSALRTFEPLTCHPEVENLYALADTFPGSNVHYVPVETDVRFPTLVPQSASALRRDVAKGAAKDEESSAAFYWTTEKIAGIVGRSPFDLSDDEILSDAQREHAIFFEPLVKKAFKVACSAHQGQFRRNGQPYVTHCVETAIILAKIGADKQVVAAGLLHDTLDDSMMNVDQLKEIFADEISELVTGVSKLSKFSQLARDNWRDFNALEAGRLRNMFLAMADVRVVLIKLADRLHNLRTLDALPLVKQQRIAKETLEIFAPLANRLGIWSWKAEIEDICFKVLKPVEHADLIVKLEERGEAVVMSSIEQLDRALRAVGVQYVDLSGRPKNLYSIHKKMVKKGRQVDEIFDVWGLRLIAPDAASCYAALDVVHSLWDITDGDHFKDYIEEPKPNGYRSIHTVVKGPYGNNVEIQIRSAEMHHQAEFGLAAHWRYKEEAGQNEQEQGSGSSSSSVATANRAVLQKVEWARWVLAWYSELSDTKIRLKKPETHLRPQCTFPSHSEGCPFASASINVPRQEHRNDEPFVVITLVDGKLGVKEVHGGSTAADILALEFPTEPDRRQQKRVLVNQEVVDDMSQSLQMGDVVELVMDDNEEQQQDGVDVFGSDLFLVCDPLPALVHGVDYSWQSPSPPFLSMDKMVVDFERQRLKACLEKNGSSNSSSGRKISGRREVATSRLLH